MAYKIKIKDYGGFDFMTFKKKKDAQNRAKLERKRGFNVEVKKV